MNQGLNTVRLEFKCGSKFDITGLLAGTFQSLMSDPITVSPQKFHLAKVKLKVKIILSSLRKREINRKFCG